MASEGNRQGLPFGQQIEITSLPCEILEARFQEKELLALFLKEGRHWHDAIREWV